MLKGTESCLLRQGNDMCKRHRIWGLEAWLLPVQPSPSHFVSLWCRATGLCHRIVLISIYREKVATQSSVARNQIRDANGKSREHEKRAEHSGWWSFLGTSHHRMLVPRECLHLVPT